MSDELYLYSVLLGATPQGRLTEQHDIFFGIAGCLNDLVPAFENFWPEAKDKIHIDAWRKVESVEGFAVTVQPREQKNISTEKLFFINLGGYKPGDFEEHHYKIIVAAADKGQAVRKAKQTAFYAHYGFEGAVSHIDDKYGVDVDDIYAIEDILAPSFKEKYTIVLTPTANEVQDALHIGYLKLEKIGENQ